MSFSDSPLSTEEPAALIETTSAESRFAASSKEELVRVLDSKKRLTTVRPRRVGTFLMSRRPTSAKLSARSRIASISSRESSSIVSRCFMRRLRRLGSEIVTSSTPSISSRLHVDPLLAGGRQVLADVVGPDRQLAMAAIAEDRELHPARPAVVEERLDRGPHRPAGEEDVVDEDDRAARRSKSMWEAWTTGWAAGALAPTSSR